MTARYDAAIAPIGVNIAQFALLRAIERGEPVTLTELAGRTRLDRSTVGRNIRVLERVDVVVLSKGEDKREATVTLSANGRRILADGAPLWDNVQAEIEARLGGSAARALRETLHSL